MENCQRDHQVALNLYHREKTPPDTKLQEKGRFAEVALSVSDLLCFRNTELNTSDHSVEFKGSEDNLEITKQRHTRGSYTLSALNSPETDSQDLCRFSSILLRL